MMARCEISGQLQQLSNTSLLNSPQQSMEEHPTKPPEEQPKPFEDFSCGLYKDRLLIPGRLYIARTYVNFQPQFGQSPVTISIADITGLYKRNTAYVFPNAIEIATKTQKFFFGSFYFRDQAFTTLQNLLPNTPEGEHDTSGEDEESHLDSSGGQEFIDDAGEKNRSRASSTNSDDEEMKPLAATKAAGQKALAAMKRTMTKSASERTMLERSHTPPPPSSFSPPPLSSSGNVSPPVSPAPRRRDDVPAIESSTHEPAHEVAGEVHAQGDATDTSVHEQHAGEAQDDAGDATVHAHTHEHHEAPVPSAPPEHSPISPIHSPSSEDLEHDNANTHAHAHEHEHELAQEAAEHPTTPTQEPASAVDAQAVNLVASASAPSSPLTNGTTTPTKKPPEHEKIKLPPITENCEHMTYPPFSDTLQPFVDETFPCPIQDFYRLILASNFWGEVNDSCGYTDVTVTPWLTRHNNSGPCCLYRQINFKMDLNGKIGPKSTRVQQSQRCRLKNSRELILETSSVSTDVPYSDSFTTDNLVIIKSTNGGASCNLRVATRVNFLKVTWGFGGLIEKNAVQGSKDFYGTWIIAVRQRIEKEYTKPRSLVTPPPVQKGAAQHSPAAHHSPQHPKSTPSRPHLSSTTSQSSPSLLPHQPAHATQHHHHHHPTQQAPSHAPPISALPAPSAFTPISPTPKKFWPNLQQQVSQLSTPVAALFVVVLLIISIGLPYTLYLHSRVTYAESQLIEFNNAVGRIENKISFMQLYINYLKEHPSSPLPPSPSSPQDDLKAELAGLAHLLDVTNSLEKRMEDWKMQLDGAGKSLASTQDLVTALRGEMGNVLLRREGVGEQKREKVGWVYFIVGILLSIGVVGASMYFFRETLPFRFK